MRMRQQIMYVLHSPFDACGTAPLYLCSAATAKGLPASINASHCNILMLPIEAIMGYDSTDAFVLFVACRMLRQPTASSSNSSSCGRRRWQRQWPGLQPPGLPLQQQRPRLRHLRAIIPWTAAGSGGCGDNHTNSDRQVVIWGTAVTDTSWC
jgi:hypothetical protein